jgi:hypothetical protein
MRLIRPSISPSFATFCHRHLPPFGHATDDGSAFLGAERAHDNPQIERGGIAYRDNLYRHRAKRGVTIVKFAPIIAVQKDLAAVSRPLRTAGVIRALAMDGPRVSLALAGSGRACDRILHWNIPWHYAAFISQPGVPAATCPKSRKRVAEVKSVALGGLGSAWVLRGGADRSSSARTASPAWSAYSRRGTFHWSQVIAD